jgi:hypothetical protein
LGVEPRREAVIRLELQSELTLLDFNPYSVCEFQEQRRSAVIADGVGDHESGSVLVDIRLLFSVAAHEQDRNC